MKVPWSCAKLHSIIIGSQLHSSFNQETELGSGVDKRGVRSSQPCRENFIIGKCSRDPELLSRGHGVWVSQQTQGESRNERKFSAVTWRTESWTVHKLLWPVVKLTPHGHRLGNEMYIHMILIWYVDNIYIHVHTHIVNALQCTTHVYMYIWYVLVGRKHRFQLCLPLPPHQREDRLHSWFKTPAIAPHDLFFGRFRLCLLFLFSKRRQENADNAAPRRTHYWHRGAWKTDASDTSGFWVQLCAYTCLCSRTL